MVCEWVEPVLIKIRINTKKYIMVRIREWDCIDCGNPRSGSGRQTSGFLHLRKTTKEVVSDHLFKCKGKKVCFIAQNFSAVEKHMLA